MEYQGFTVEIDGRIAHIELDRPEKRNALTRGFWRDLPIAVSTIEATEGVRVIVISSTGPHFTSGIDVSMFGQDQAFAVGADRKSRAQRASHFLTLVKPLQATFNALENCRIPVLAAVQGGCIGGGVDFTTACDMRYVTKDAFFTIFETNIGMTADVGTFPRIAKLLPEGIVRELAYTGRRMGADEAMRLGFVNGVYETQAEMMDGVMAVAMEIASKAPHAVYGCKRMITYARDHSTADALDYIAVWNAGMLSAEEIMESMAANAQKRDADHAELPPLPKAL
ncbi:MAG: crotonase/enoyl-CoA hydratase family protein [Pseudomonadota bacterium]